MITPEQIRSLAIRAGLAGATGTQVPMHKLEAFADLVADAEREACLKECEQIASKYHMKRYATDWQAQECIAAIKARGQS
jgi:lambda repressor-like predicted transcriptional regulator